jgi:hypothetical protein
MKFTLNVKKSDPVMDTQIQAGDMLVQDKDTDDRKIYLAVEILGDIKLVNVNSAQTYNKEGYGDLTRQEVVNIVSGHFNKYPWKFIQVDKIASKDINIVLKA